jgi:ABC-type dipeptide/oligopeptide/nickel transport system ATPase subunit
VSGFALPGQTLYIMGASGAGKTSLLNIISDRISTNKGDILKNEIFTSKVFASNEVLQDIVNCKENTYAKNEIMKCNIIRNPVIDHLINSTINSMKSICLQESWEKIEDVSIINMEPLVNKVESGSKEERGKVELGSELEVSGINKINNKWFFDWFFNK